MSVIAVVVIVGFVVAMCLMAGASIVSSGPGRREDDRA
jgi:hypothetical protein